MTASVSDLSSTAQDYLKLIWTATEWSATPITVTALATRLGVRPATISDGIRRLADTGLVEHEPYGAIELTEAGRAHAVEMVRRHRLIETFLVQTLGYGWDEVHDEAEVLEHAVSDHLVERIDVLLGRPQRDPHGDPIPAPHGAPRRARGVRLSEMTVGVDAVVERISDADPAVLRELEGAGVLPGTRVRVLEAEAAADASVPPASASVRLQLGRRTVAVSGAAADAIWMRDPGDAV